MKIGFSYGRCVRDIVNGLVNFDEVLLIYAATCITTEQQVVGVMASYGHHRDYLLGLDQEACKEVALRLWHSGKIHQPRVNGHSVRRIAESGVWMDLAPTLTNDGQQSELVQKAWRDYQMALKLSSPDAIPADQFKPRTAEEQAELDAAIDLLAGSI
jgi:hypothetical protein